MAVARMFSGAFAMMLLVGQTFAASPDSTVQNLPKSNWQTRSFSMSDFYLSTDGPLKLVPTVPSATADEATWTKYLQEATGLARKHFEKLGLPLPAGTAFAFEHSTSTVAVRTRLEEMNALENYFEAELRRQPLHVVFQLNIVQADGAVLRQIVHDAQSQAHLGKQWEQVKQLAAKGQARILHSASFDNTGGSRVRIDAGPKYFRPESLKVDASGHSQWKHFTRMAGFHLEVDPVISPDQWRVDVDFAFEYHYAPPTERLAPVGDGGPLGSIEVPVTDYHCAKITSSMAFGGGVIRLLGAWVPEGVPALEKQDVMQAAFLRTDCVRLSGPPNTTLAAVLERHAAKAMPLSAKDLEFVVPPGMQVKIFKVPADLFSLGGTPEKQAPGAPPDPFAGAYAAPAGSMWLRDFLKATGIKFPEGSHVFFDRKACRLTMINTPENLDNTEAFVDSIMWCIHPNGIVHTLRIIQADGATLRQIAEGTATRSDHAEVLRKLEEMAAQGKAKIVTTQRLETRTGTKGSLSAGEEHLAITKLRKSDAQGERKANIESVFAGTRFETESIMGPDGYTVGINATLEHHYLPPTSHFLQPAIGGSGKANALQIPGTEARSAKAQINTTFWTGQTRLIASWKPEGLNERNDDDLLQAAFLTVTWLKYDQGDEQQQR